MMSLNPEPMNVHNISTLWVLYTYFSIKTVLKKMFGYKKLVTGLDLLYSEGQK